MKIAIHESPGSFSDRWIPYCKENNLDYKIVNCYDTNIIDQLSDCNGLMWHWNHDDYKAKLFARQLTHSLEKNDIKVFPNSNTSWHFDDKLGQKYLFEAIDAPLVKSYVFYSEKETRDWIDKTTFPKVFKLRGGAESINVQLVKTKAKARRLAKKAFHRGFLPINRLTSIKNRFWILRRDKDLAGVKKVIGGFARLFVPTEFDFFSNKQKGYIYFQDFIPGQKYDTRLVVIGVRCFGVRRNCRKGDFRASGSGLCEYEPNLIEKECILTAFETAKKLKIQSVAFDLVMDGDTAKILEISYCFPMGPIVDKCPGYWDEYLNWHNTEINPQYFMIEDFIGELEEQARTL